MTPVRYLDLGAEYAEIGEQTLGAIETVLARGHFVLGPEVEAFEAEFAAYCGAAFCVGVDSGTSAVTLALRALGVGRGDEVITQPNTYFATVAAIIATGAKAVFADLTPPTYAIDPAAVERALTPRTRAVVAVHMFGQPCDLRTLSAICSRQGVALVEDAAQAHGASIDGCSIGGFASAATCFSFYPSKNLGAYGEAGAVTTNEAHVATAIRALRNHGGLQKNRHDSIGVNGRIDELQAAVLRVKLRHLDEWNRRRREVAAFYDGALADVAKPLVPRDVVPSRHVYPIFIEERDRVRRVLEEQAIETNVHYPIACHLAGALRGEGYAFAHGDYPTAERMAETELSLPISPWHEAADLERVVAGLRLAIRRSQNHSLP